jgi:hypothetical protein
MENNLTNGFEELKVLLETIEVDLLKNAGGNKSAGTRVRKGLRLLKNNAAALVKVSLETDKTS